MYRIEGHIDHIAQTARQLLGFITKSKPFIVGFSGDLGSGKTTLIRAILLELGHDPLDPVTSPTFTLVNEYQIGSQLYGHLDLYRLDTSRGSIDDFIDTQRFDGLFVEWPNKLSIANRLTSLIRISSTHQPDCRVYELLEVTEST